MDVKSLLVRGVYNMWYNSPDDKIFKLARLVLSPACQVYLRIMSKEQQHRMKHVHNLDSFVISVGNLVVGGGGKTPLAMWLARLFVSKGLRVAILSRGYKRRAKGIGKVPEVRNNHRQLSEVFGDEPVLIATLNREISIWVGKDRAHVGKIAVACEFPHVVILDDGFQHLSLRRDIDLVLLKSEQPFGNGHILPLGPLREPYSNLKRADAFVVIDTANASPADLLIGSLRASFPEKPVFYCVQRIQSLRIGLSDVRIPISSIIDKPILAFAGIAHPEHFFRMLRNTGLNLMVGIPFPDHHRYTANDICTIMDASGKVSARFIVTTGKDTVRLPSWMHPFVLTAEPELDFREYEDQFVRYLMCKISKRE